MELPRAAGALLLAGLVGLAVTACTAVGEQATAPTPAPSSAPTATPTAAPAPDGRPVVTGGLGSDGLTVRYQDRDGSTKTLRVEDFRR